MHFSLRCDRSAIQTMRYDSFLVTCRSVPITSIFTDFTLGSWKDFDEGLSLISSWEMTWKTCFGGFSHWEIPDWRTACHSMNNFLNKVNARTEGPFTLCDLRLWFVFAHNGLNGSWWCCHSHTVWTLALSPVQKKNCSHNQEKTHRAFFSDYDCNSCDRNKWVLQDSMEVFTQCDYDNIINSYSAHCK